MASGFEDSTQAHEIKDTETQKEKQLLEEAWFSQPSWAFTWSNFQIPHQRSYYEYPWVLEITFTTAVLYLY